MESCRSTAARRFSTKRLWAVVLPMQVPLEVEIGTGANWLEAH